MHPLAHFNFETHRIRVSMDERGEPWFVAADVCAALGIANSRDALSHLEAMKGVSALPPPWRSPEPWLKTSQLTLSIVCPAPHTDAWPEDEVDTHVVRTKEGGSNGTHHQHHA
ncbi:Bro-N domain-containing protein [Myxococcus llanfairpwllgwyngyllgogerychwyrndrobwllllantysiliogogogochensis]|nr:BRO family protein [Myxococcus llanfairpwllgwyngyllgogerychwyrndrobwllllantysiliogogogochensis]